VCRARCGPGPTGIIGVVMGGAHRGLGAVFGLGYGIAAGLPAAGVVGCGVLGTLSAAGPLSPDVDQHPAWRRADRWTPDEALGHGGPMQHRGITHWWGLALLFTCAWWFLLVPFTGDGGRGSLIGHGAGALLAGWWSHLTGDAVFGRADVRSGRGPGIPILPWWGHAGISLAVGGWLERTTGVLLWLVAAGQLLDHVGVLRRVLDAGRVVVLGP